MARIINWTATIKRNKETIAEEGLEVGVYWFGSDNVTIRIDTSPDEYVAVIVPLREFAYYMREFIDVLDAASDEYAL